MGSAITGGGLAASAFVTLAFFEAFPLFGGGGSEGFEGISGVVEVGTGSTCLVAFGGRAREETGMAGEEQREKDTEFLREEAAPTFLSDRVGETGTEEP